MYFSFYEVKICFQNRFLFLDRAGLYKHPSAKSLGSSKSAFPLVSDVVGGTDEEFLEKVSIFSRRYRRQPPDMKWPLETFSLYALNLAQD